jgi:two-component system cell cycle response regulator DivK
MSAASTTHIRQAARGRILIVEDTRDTRALLKAVFEAEGYEVLEAADGIEAVEVALAELPDAIIMDMSLPRIDGNTAVKIIRREPALRSTPVIACTAHNQWEWRGKSIVAGCDAFITKPIDFAQLRAVLAQLLARRQDS